MVSVKLILKQIARKSVKEYIYLYRINVTVFEFSIDYGKYDFIFVKSQRIQREMWRILSGDNIKFI